MKTLLSRTLLKILLSRTLMKTLLSRTLLKTLLSRTLMKTRQDMKKLVVIHIWKFFYSEFLIFLLKTFFLIRSVVGGICRG